jgi:hypothetical protein
VSATQALKAARDAGIVLGIAGDDLVLEASEPPPAAILDLLSGQMGTRSAADPAESPPS